MVVNGSQERNNEAIREMLGNAQFTGDGQYIITDARNKKIKVDTKTGKIYRYRNGKEIECNTGEKSRKKNGYLYVKIAIQLDTGDKIDIDYAQHSLIAMLEHTEEYDNFVFCGTMPIVNHKNNCPWDNSSKNLEWTDCRLNILHGKLVRGINLSVYSNKYTEIRHNMSEVDFVCLKQGISVKLIKEYEEYIKLKGHKSLNEYWGLDDKIRKTDVINIRDIISFMGWVEAERLKKGIN